MTKFRLVLAAAGLAAVTAPSAYAQKSKDTLVIATTDPFSTVDSYIQPDVEVAQFTDTVFGHLLVFDERKGTFLPELAKSWTQVDPTTIDFDLRNDVVYHSGNKFTSGVS